ncbi:myb-binding protein 1A-like protein [Micropterus salmoides]|uniref:myb-binding protein 1A-like protein n=1 Tax=Micropterus salmoides TaxID=27706 RepID=UPI0018EA4742|nr:myb-binding protein 1A-like protein [Micropterus salmoides]
MSVEMVEVSVKAAEPVRPAGILQQNRVFLDFFWDLAKPDQEVRLKAVEDLIQYLKTNNKADELDYTFKRLVDGLAHTRETARPGFSLALGQVLSAFEDVSLQSVLNRIKEKHNLQTVKKKLVRNALFGNLFGVLALHQSSRLSKEPQVVLGCVQLLQSLSQQRQHLKDLPTKTMMDILNEIPEEVFEEVLFSALKTDLASAFSTPEQLQLLLVALQRFPQTLKPKKLKKLLGSSTIINADNIPKLTEVLKMAARSVKKECVLPAVVLDLLKLSLKEDSFQLFWNNAIINGMLKEQPGPAHYLSFRLLGSALPLLSEAQLKEVLSGEVMMHYGEHVVSAQKPDRFKLAPEMDTYVSDFLQGCQDSDKQLAVMVGFSSLTNQGYPVVPSVWRVVQHLQPAALRHYVDWLKKTFLQPQLDKLLDFSTRKQKGNQEGREEKENIFRLRKWIVARLASIIDNHQVKRQEDLIMDVARFVFFHAFFSAKKAWADIPETEGKLSVPLDDKTRGVLVNSFFGLLLSMHHLPLTDDSAEGSAVNQKRALGVTADGTMWIYHLVQYAQVLLNQPKHVQSSQPFSPEQRQAWDSMLESVANLKKKAKKGASAESGAFQQLFLLVGMHLFKAPEELLDIMKDLQSCVDKALEKKAKKKKKKQATEQEEEPEWVEVMVDILLSLLSQPSRHIRQVCKTVFTSICPHVTAAALTAILDVLDPEKDDEEDSAVVVTDDNKTKKPNEEDDEDEEMEDDESDGSDDEEDEDDDDEDDDDDAMEEEEEDVEEGEVDQNFRLELMKVLQQQNALATEEDGSSDEDLDDEAMMELDKGLSALFSEQKKKNQAKKDEKTKLQKEKTLVRDFKIKVLDLVEVFVARQAGSPLVLGLVEPLLTIIDKGMSSDTHQQEQDFLRRAADIFRNQLCRSKVYCRTVGDRQGELHDLLDKLMTKTQKLSDSSVCLYYFSASLYVVKVLRGAPTADTKEEQTAGKAAANDLRFMGNVDVDRVSAVFREALSSFMSKRKSPLTAQMFTDLFNRFPVLCVNLLDAAVQHITSGIRVHQQGQACVLVLRAMQSREVQQLLSGARWTELCVKVTGQLAASLQQVGQTESKVVKEKVVKTLELCQFLVKHVNQQKLSVDLEPLQRVLQSLPSIITFNKTGKLEDTYWAVMKHFGVMKPKVEKTKPDMEANQQQVPKKKKGFLPETKKRKKRNKPVLEPAGGNSTSTARPGAEKRQAKKKNDNKTKQKRPANGAAASQPNPAKKSKTQSVSKPAKKKNKKPKQKKEGGGQM